MNTAESMDYYDGLLADLEELSEVLTNAAVQPNSLLKQPELEASGRLFRSLMREMPLALGVSLRLGNQALQGMATLGGVRPHEGHYVPLSPGDYIGLNRFFMEDSLVPYDYHVGNREVLLAAGQVAETLQQGGELNIGPR